MRKAVSSVFISLLLFLPSAYGYVEAPHSFGRVCQESTTIVYVEITKVDKDKNLIIFKKLADLKGKHPTDTIKHNIGKGGFHPREWQNIMEWAEVGKKAVFFHNGGASETCMGNYWYQAYPNGEWWGMSHAEPFLLRTYVGDIEKLVELVKQVVAGKEVIVPCFADGNKDQFHQKKGKLQRMKAGLKLLDYNPKRDFVGWGGDGDEVVEEFKTYTPLKESADGWKFMPAAKVTNIDWVKPGFDDKAWRTGKAPIGMGEEEIEKRKGTTVEEKGESFLFRRLVEVPADLLNQKDVTFRLNIASDDRADVYVNGNLVDKDPEEDHEFAYWNREIEVPLKTLKPGQNLIAAIVKNKPNSSDIYFDAELVAAVPIPKPPKVSKGSGSGSSSSPTGSFKTVTIGSPKMPAEVTIDKDKGTVSIPCVIAPRKLPNLQEIYPIEVFATFAAPKGQKAHETVVNIAETIKPGDVHKALLELSLKPGKPVRGEGKVEGPVVKLFLEFEKDGKVQRVPIEKTLVDRSGKPIGELTWYFTGSVLRQPDPEKDDSVYGADLSGTLISFFPVTDETVFQSQLTMKDESQLKLETEKKVLPKEGTNAKLIISVK